MDTVALAALLLPLWLTPTTPAHDPPGAPEEVTDLATTAPAQPAAAASPDDPRAPVSLRPARSGTFVVDNPGRDRLRVRLVPTSWTQTPTADHLERTDDLQLTHTVIELSPGESRTIGVRSARPVSAMERAYQILLEELGDAEASPRRGVQVFVEPPVPRPVSRIVDVRLFYRTASFVLRNPGSAHFRAERVEVVGLSTSGAPVFTRVLPGGVVLAGSSRFHAIDLPEESCRATTVEVHVETEHGPITATLGSPSCT